MGDLGIGVMDGDIQYSIPGGDFDRVSQGLIDHCFFYDMYKPTIHNYGYGVMIARASNWEWTPWDLPIDVFGKYLRNVFIEDCYFRGMRHAVAASNGGYYVFRHNVNDDMAVQDIVLTGHPNRLNYNGMGGFEAYDNIFKHTGLYYPGGYHGITAKGGSAIITDNLIQDLYSGVQVGTCDAVDPNYHPRGHPNNIYIWNNIYERIKWYNFNNLEKNRPDSDPEKPLEGREYFFHEPAGGYVKYRYPHPLALEETPLTHRLTINSNINGVPFNIRRIA